jgi:hypothetical protein
MMCRLNASCAPPSTSPTAFVCLAAAAFDEDLRRMKNNDPRKDPTHAAE